MSVFSSLTGQMIKERCLPCVFGVEYDDEIKALAVNDNQLAVVTVPEDHYVLMVFQLDSLLSESPSQEISHRTFEFDQNYCGLHSLVLHQTSICVVLEGVGEEDEAPPPKGSMEDSLEAFSHGGRRRRIPKVNLITFDFWNCET